MIPWRRCDTSDLSPDILDVQLWHQTNAVVIAQTPRDIDLCFLTLVGGQWLNDGNDGAPNLGGAQRRIVSIWAFRQAWWGQPRYEWWRLGPLEAWHYGSGWKQRSRDAAYRELRKDTGVIRREAELLFTALRQADYSQVHNWRAFPSPNVGFYCVQTRRDDWTHWICQRFRTNPIVQMELGEVFYQAGGRPAVPYKLVLNDRTTLEDVLPFDWSPDAGRWEGHQGLDRHLRQRT